MTDMDTILNAAFAAALGPAFTGAAPIPRKGSAYKGRSVVEYEAGLAGVRPSDIYGPTRARKVAWPRQKIMARLHKELRWSTPRIGAFLGDRDHTTVLHGIRAYEKRMKEGEEW